MCGNPYSSTPSEYNLSSFEQLQLEIFDDEDYVRLGEPVFSPNDVVDYKLMGSIFCPREVDFAPAVVESDISSSEEDHDEHLDYFETFSDESFRDVVIGDHLDRFENFHDDSMDSVRFSQDSADSLDFPRGISCATPS